MAGRSRVSVAVLSRARPAALFRAHATPDAATTQLLISLVQRAQREHGGAVRAAQVLELASLEERARLPLHRFGARSFGFLLTRCIGVEAGGLQISSCGKPNGSGSYRVIEAKK